MSALLERHLGFVAALRRAGVPVAVSEDLDALAAVRAVSWERRAALREAYAAALLKRQRHRDLFDSLFDLWWPPRVGDGAAPTAADDGIKDGGEALADLRRRVAAALDRPVAGSRPADLEALAVEAVARFGRLAGGQGGQGGQGSWSAYTALRRVEPGSLGGDAAATAAFEDAVRREALRRIAEQRGAEHAARAAVRPPVDRIGFLSASAADLAAVRREVAPLARRLAVRLTRDHRRGRRGPLDVRRTVRASLATGGVPLSPQHRPRRPRRADLVVLCDVSGSVAHFARFTLLLVIALREQFRGVRAFAFVDDVVEVTDRLRPDADVAAVLADLRDASGRAVSSGRTDYGRSLRRFAAEHAEAVGPRTTLLVLGDARSNYGDLALPTLRGLVDDARRAWWLNPEPARHWDTGDSAASSYAGVVEMVECRDLDQLGRFVRAHW